MGCDIHPRVEVKKNNKWIHLSDVSVFDWRSYSVFGFLADVRNYSLCPSIKEAVGFPDDVSEDVLNEFNEMWNWDGHNLSFLTLKELIDFDYDNTFEDRRYTEQVAPNVWDGGSTSAKGCGEVKTFRDHLGSCFFKDIEELKKLGNPENVRVVFWFDN